jgi:ParB family chromosome partitioning protein
MIKKKRSGLGSGMTDMTRGISELYSSGADNASPESPKESNDNAGQPLLVPIANISENPDQPRKYFNTVELTKLADSIKSVGVIEPLVVRATLNADKYQLLVGHRRLIAAKQAGLSTVPVIISDTPDDAKQRLEIAMMENLLRDDLNPIEEAEGYNRLENEIGVDVLAIAKLFGKDRTTITNSVRLLSLPEEVKDDIRTKVLTAGHGKALLAITDPNNLIEARNAIISKKLTVRATESLAKKLNNKNKAKDAKDTNSSENDDFYKSLAGKISESIGGLNVVINHGRGKKRIEIYYSNNNEIENIINKLKITV